MRKSKAMPVLEDVLTDKAGVNAAIIESFNKISTLNQVYIEERPVICKNCGNNFTSKFAKCYEVPEIPDRCAILCPECNTQNLIKKVLTIFKER